jgi:hypothetical protein
MFKCLCIDGIFTWIVTRPCAPGCVINMITSLGWQSLEQRRQNSRLYACYTRSSHIILPQHLNFDYFSLFMTKIHTTVIQHNLIDINRDLYIRHSDSRTRGQHRLFQERTKNETYRNSFFQRTVRDWNLLPASTVAEATIEEFSL